MHFFERIAAALIGHRISLDKFDADKYALFEKADRGRIAVVGVAA
jgi:hypothetical protein